MREASARIIRPFKLKRWSVEDRAVMRGLLVTLIVLVITVASTFRLSQLRTTDLLDQVHYDEVFEASQAETALFRLNAEIGRFALSPSDDGADRVRLRFDIFVNHVDVLSNGIARRSVDAIAPDLPPVLNAAVAAVTPVIPGIQAPEQPQHALELLTPLEGRMAQAVTAMSEDSLINLADRGQALQNSGHALLALALALLITAVGLALVLWRQHAATRRLAYLDAVTSLANRFAINEDLLARTLSDNDVALLLIDLDHFKDVNDSFGHDIGDALLQQIASRLRAVIPTASTIARIGGDEFAVLLDVAATAEEATSVAELRCGTTGHRSRSGT